MKSTDVLLVTRGLYCAGVERTILTLLQGLLEHGQCTKLALLESPVEIEVPSSLEEHIVRPNGGVLERVLLRRFWDPLRVFLRHLRYGLILQWQILKFRPKVFMTTCMQSMIAGRFVFKLGAKWVGSVGSDVSDGLRRELPRVRIPIQWTISWVYRKVDLMLTPSASLKDVINREFGVESSKLIVVPNPFDVTEIQRQATEEVQPQNFLLGVGRLAQVKGFDTLIRALAELPDTRLLLIGEGPERSNLESLAVECGVSQRVAMPGLTNNPWKYMKGAQIVVVPSLSEGFSNVLLEALAVGACVVVSDCAHGPREIVNSSAVAKMFPVGDVNALVEAVRELLSNPQLRREMSVAAQERAWEYDVAAVIPRYLDALATVQA